MKVTMVSAILALTFLTSLFALSALGDDPVEGIAVSGHLLDTQTGKGIPGTVSFMGAEGSAITVTTGEEGGFSCSMKLPYRAAEALEMKGAAPTGYGLGTAGWVSFRFGAKSRAPVAKLIDYLDESWRAVAPKKLSATFPPPRAKGRPARTLTSAMSAPR